MHILVSSPSPSKWLAFLLPDYLWTAKGNTYIYPCFCSKAASRQAACWHYTWPRVSLCGLNVWDSVKLILTLVTNDAHSKLLVVSQLRPKWVWSGWQHSHHHCESFHCALDEQQLMQRCWGMTRTDSGRPWKTLLIWSLEWDVLE